MTKITAETQRSGCSVVVVTDGEKESFFAAAIDAFAAMHPSETSESMIGDFLTSLVSYMIDEELEWIAGDKKMCEQQDRAMLACVSALKLLKKNALRDRQIKKAEEFIAGD